MTNALATIGMHPLDRSSRDATELRDAFQKFVAGTFYKQMFKAMRKTVGKSAYFHGGQAEEIFRSQMDQEVAEQLAEQRGNSFSETLFRSFARNLKMRMDSPANGPGAR
ncbi:MAG: rod-binding protein [Planctomycetaceae bacterium]